MQTTEAPFTPVPNLIPFTLQPSPAGDQAPAFTQGPWRATIDNRIFSFQYQAPLACAYWQKGNGGLSPSRDESIFNAALIAAAPDLYYAARVALDKLEHLPGQSAVAVAALASAIRKAEGRL